MSQKFLEVLSELQVSNNILPLLTVIKTKVDDIYTLLFLNNGPLRDGYQENEWVSISILTSTWIFSLVPLLDSNFYNDIKPVDIGSLVLEIIIALIKKDVILISPVSTKDSVLLFLDLSKNVLITLVVSNLLKLDMANNCCFPKNNTNKVIKEQLNDSKINNKILASLPKE